VFLRVFIAAERDEKQSTGGMKSSHIRYGEGKGIARKLEPGKASIL
jgi:hypothetical protein